SIMPFSYAGSMLLSNRQRNHDVYKYRCASYRHLHKKYIRWQIAKLYSALIYGFAFILVSISSLRSVFLLRFFIKEKMKRKPLSKLKANRIFRGRAILNMRRISLLKLLILIFTLGVAAQQGLAQQKISGTVIDDVAGKGVPQASIQVRGTSDGTSCGASGQFFLTTTSPFPLQLVVSAVGYKQLIISVDSLPQHL